MEKAYHVYGIGNALVDLVVEVEHGFFDEHGIEKGLMTLVEEDRQETLVAALDGRHSKMQCGGSAANTVIAVSQFGGKSYYSCKVANDDFGRFYFDDMRQNGVDTNLDPEHLMNGTTGKCLVFVSPDADRTMNTFLGITTNYSRNEIHEQELTESEYLYMEGYLITSPNGKDAMLHARKLARENQVKTSMTFSDPSMVKYFREDMDEVLGEGVDLLFCNEEEAMIFTGTDSAADAIRSLRPRAETLVVTLGSKGAAVLNGTDQFEIKSHPIDALDTVGAGDMFAGAFLYGITQGMDFQKSGDLASIAAAKVVSQFGPRITPDQAVRLLAEFQGTSA